ncbi:MAG: DUF4166 domain-containing protein [Chloroflexi bacterium]|nr:DUF4166 domain-containing protein [Chloroflexota bacterium]
MNELPTFRAALGADFEQLAPVLRRHYDLAPGAALTIRGRMRAWSRFPWLRLFLPFMPIPAESVDVTVHNRGVLDHGEVCYEWVRLFSYQGRTLESYTLTRSAPGSACVLDTFNRPANIGMTLGLSVAEGGMALQQENAGPQFAIFGARRLALPSFLHVQTTATERALDAVTIRTEVVIRQRFLGPLFGYEGELEVQN